ncbi:iron transporter [Olsenella sp. oral taxon 807]|nr:iron transporter [Olsenella sp. oral taxon 807]
MFVANFLIALREGVEAALVVGILIAYIYKVGRKDIMPKLWLGVALATVVPLGLGVWWTWGPYTITFQTQEILGGSLSIVAMVFVTWMIFWMGKNSRKLAQSVRTQAEEALDAGNVMGLVWLAIISVGREGAETAVFVWATVKSSGEQGIVGPAAGVLLGLVAAIVVGYLIYKGSVLINIHKFFAVTGYLLILVAAGIIMYGIKDLQEAGVIPGYAVYLYNYTDVITDVAGTWWFVLLRAFFNLDILFAPTSAQLAAWIAYLQVVLPLFTLQVWGVTFPNSGGSRGKWDDIPQIRKASTAPQDSEEASASQVAETSAVSQEEDRST